MLAALTCLSLATLLATPIATSNPVNIVLSLLWTSAIVFCWMTVETGSSWVSILSFLIFVGGILIAFIIATAAYPNENFNSHNNYTAVIGAMWAWNSITHSNNDYTTISENTNEMAISLSIITWTSLIILIFITMSISLLSNNNSSIRSHKC